MTPSFDLDPVAITSLQPQFRGRLLTPGADGYDSARSLHNGMIDRRPAVIVRCAGVSDVRRSLDLAQRHNLPISLRCGAHGVPGYAVVEGGVMIDLSEMSAVTVDPAQGTARAQGGTNWGQFDHETQAFGLATTGGLVRTTGIAGLTLSGGHGFLMRRFGLACDNLISADVLTAGGELVKASATQNPDLFWALRGGGGNFGVVTNFEYRLHPVGPILGGLLILPFQHARKALTFYDEFAASAPDELGVLCALGTLPDGTKAVVHPICYCGAIDDGERLLKPLRTATPPIADQIQPMPYTAVQSIVENFNPRGFRNYWKTVYLSQLTGEVAGLLADHYARVPAPLSHIVVYTLGGATARVPEAETAVSSRGARHAVIAIGMWDHASADEANIGWVQHFAKLLQPYAIAGFYPNYEANVPPDRLAAAFGPGKYERLQSIKQKYDPTNLFRLNQNIQPAGV